MDQAPDLPEAQSASPIIRVRLRGFGCVFQVANLVLSALRGNSSKPRAEKGWHKTYKQLLRLTKKVRVAENSPGAKIYEMRMYDLVLGNERPTRSPLEPVRSRRPALTAFLQRTKRTLMEDAMELLNMMTKKSKGERSLSNGKVLSPRFAPLLPDKVCFTTLIFDHALQYETTNRHFSPSVLSFYHDDTEEQVASIPKESSQGVVVGPRALGASAWS